MKYKWSAVIYYYLGVNNGFKKELNELKNTLKLQRDEIEVQIHHASMDAKEEWQKAENNWGQFVKTLGEITDETKETSTELIHATKVIGDELKGTYQRFSLSLGK